MRIYLQSLLVLFLVMVGNIAGILFHLYGNVDSYDIFMHLFGGLGLGLFAAAILELHAPRQWRTRSMIVLFVFIAGIAWELFEAYYNIAGAPLGTTAYWIDTVKDLINDSLGGLIIAVIRARSWIVEDSR